MTRFGCNHTVTAASYKRSWWPVSTVTLDPAFGEIMCPPASAILSAALREKKKKQPTPGCMHSGDNISCLLFCHQKSLCSGTMSKRVPKGIRQGAQTLSRTALLCPQPRKGSALWVSSKGSRGEHHTSRSEVNLFFSAGMNWHSISGPHHLLGSAAQDHTQIWEWLLYLCYACHTLSEVARRSSARQGVRGLHFPEKGMMAQLTKYMPLW